MPAEPVTARDHYQAAITRLEQLGFALSYADPGSRKQATLFLPYPGFDRTGFNAEGDWKIGFGGVRFATPIQFREQAIRVFKAHGFRVSRHQGPALNDRRRFNLCGHQMPWRELDAAPADEHPFDVFGLRLLAA